jgi:hypothetical protein
LPRESFSHREQPGLRERLPQGQKVREAGPVRRQQKVPEGAQGPKGPKGPKGLTVEPEQKVLGAGPGQPVRARSPERAE